VSVARAVLEAAHQKITQANKSLSGVHKKRGSIAENGKVLTTQPDYTVNNHQLIND